MGTAGRGWATCVDFKQEQAGVRVIVVQGAQTKQAEPLLEARGALRSGKIWRGGKSTVGGEVPCGTVQVMRCTVDVKK